MFKWIAICITALTLAGCYTPPPAPPSTKHPNLYPWCHTCEPRASRFGVV